MGKSHISLNEKKNLKLHSRVPICLFIWKSNEKTNALFVNSAFFFFLPRTGSWSDGWGGFSGALNSANRYLMYDIKLIYENKTGVHTYFFSGLNICDCFWFCIISFLLLLLYRLSFLFLFTWIVVENFLLKREWNKQLHLFHIDG